jgi:hypothetical protein
VPISVPSTTAAPKQIPPSASSTPTETRSSPDSFASYVIPVMTSLVGAFSGAAVDETWSSFTNASSDNIATDTVLNSGRWGNLKPEQIDQVSDQLANFMIKAGMDVNVEEIKSQARQVLESMEPPLDESTIAELLEGSKGLFSGNPGSLNYVDPTTGMNKIDTLLASFGEKYKDVLVQINSGSVKSEDEAKGLVESFRKEMSGYIKENFFGDERGGGKLTLQLQASGQYWQEKKDAEENSFNAGNEISKASDPQDEDGQSPVAEMLNV